MSFDKNVGMTKQEIESALALERSAKAGGPISDIGRTLVDRAHYQQAQDGLKALSVLLLLTANVFLLAIFILLLVQL